MNLRQHTTLCVDRHSIVEIIAYLLFFLSQKHLFFTWANKQAVFNKLESVRARTLLNFRRVVFRDTYEVK